MTRVCPHCGEPPGAGVFCESCGRNLAGIEQLPTRSEWEAAQAPPDVRTPAEATAAFLEAMRAAGSPGTSDFPLAVKVGPFKRTPKATGWVVRPVDREDFERPKRYSPGLVLTVEGHFHQLDSELRGWGQRDFPVYHHTVAPDPIEPPEDGRLIGELAAVLRANGVSAGSGT
jgi:hypothetical protein